MARSRQRGAQTYYVAGPPGDGHGRAGMLKSAGVTTEDIRSEKFVGY